MEPTSRFATGADGNRIHYLEWSSAGVPMLLLHGFGNDAHIWDDFAPSVAPYYRTIAMDHRGHGDSDWAADGRYDYDSMVRDVEAVTAELEIDRLVVVGHSMGGRVSTLFVDRHPERIAGFVLIDIGPDLDPRGSMRIRMDIESDPDPTFVSISEYARALTLAYPEAQPHAIERMARHGLRRREDGLYVLKIDPALRGGVAGDDPESRHESLSPELQWAALGRAKCPTLVVRGAASDILSADTADRMVDEVLADGRLAVVPRAGHSVMTDNPDGFRDAVTAFVIAED